MQTAPFLSKTALSSTMQPLVFAVLHDAKERARVAHEVEVKLESGDDVIVALAEPYVWRCVLTKLAPPSDELVSNFVRRANDCGLIDKEHPPSIDQVRELLRDPETLHKLQIVERRVARLQAQRNRTKMLK